MKYMLVLQWPCADTMEEFDLLIAIEDQITENIENYGEVDGHDSGPGEMNIFIYTENPKSTFELIKKLPLVTMYISNLQAAYRVVGEAEFVPLFPVGLTNFAIV